MARKAFRRSSISRGPQDLIWVSTLIRFQHSATAATSVTVLAAADWARVATSGERATLLRVHGNYSIVPDDTTPLVGKSNIGFMLSIGDDDATATGNWLADASLIEPEAPIHVHVTSVSNMTTAAQDANPRQYHYDFDSKAKRKLTTGQGLDASLAMDNFGGAVSVYEATLFTRCLVKPS